MTFHIQDPYRSESAPSSRESPSKAELLRWVHWAVTRAEEELVTQFSVRGTGVDFLRALAADGNALLDRGVGAREPNHHGRKP